MDITAILGGIKGKVLDAVNFDLLKATYELQNENVEQLKTNSAALQLSNSLLLERTASLEKEVERIRQENKQLRELIPSGDEITNYIPSGLAAKIIRAFLSYGESTIFGDRLRDAVGSSALEIEVAFKELVAHGVGSIDGYGVAGPMYCLTDAGKKFALDFSQR